MIIKKEEKMSKVDGETKIHNVKKIIIGHYVDRAPNKMTTAEKVNKKEVSKGCIR